MKFLLYGAYGYTGKIILSNASSYGLSPVIAGRSGEKLRSLASEFGVAHLTFDLSDVKNIEKHVSGFQAVLHCAGPFSRTAKPMVRACLAAGVHYLDITGEIETFEWVKSQHDRAIESNICLISGVGFDVVPTDCIAKLLHEQMPDASRLTLAFASLDSGVSHGTATTLLENLGKPGAVRQDGQIKAVPLGHKRRSFDFGGQIIFTMTIPWGDISTAFTTTGIPNIEVYTSVPKQIYQFLKLQMGFNWLLRTSFIRNMLKRNIDRKLIGPTSQQRSKGRSLVLGIVGNEKGDQLQAILNGPEGYNFTSHASLIAIKHVLTNNSAAGYHTPAGLFGADFATKVPGTTLKMMG